MLAAYVDLPQLGLPRLGPFSPFIGGGVGASYIDIGKTRSGEPVKMLAYVPLATGDLPLLSLPRYTTVETALG